MPKRKARLITLLCSVAYELFHSCLVIYHIILSNSDTILCIFTADVSSLLLEGSLNCIGLHRRGLYCTGDVSTSDKDDHIFYISFLSL